MIRAVLARFLPAGSFVRNVGVLTGGTVVAQGLAVLALPLLTRLYSPEDFALLAVYMAIMGIATVVSCLRYNIAIPLPEDDVNAMALVAVSLAAATSISILIALPVMLAPVKTAAFLGQPGLLPYLWMVPLGVFFASTYNALQFWSSRKQRFGLVARTRMTRAVCGIGAQAAIGSSTMSPFGLIFGQMLYGGLGIVGLAHNLWRFDREVVTRLRGWQIVEQFVAYRRFPLWSVPEALFNTAGIQLPIILIASTTGGAEAGFLMLAMRVIGLPTGLVGSSVSQVFISEAPARFRDGTLSEFTRITMWKLFLVGAPPIIAAGAISPFLFAFVFGAEWVRAGWLVTWMTPWFLLQFIISPVSVVLHVTSRQRLAMMLQAFGLLFRLAMVAIGVSAYPKYVSEIYAITGTIFCIVYIAILLKLNRRHD